MRALVIGASGLVGGALLRAAGADAVGTYHTRRRPGLRALDAADRDAVARLVEEVRADAILFPAGTPDVEWCEEHPAEARTQNLVPLRAALAATRDLPFVAFSSDYVFDGTAGPYGESDPPAPISVYGRIKRELEAVLLAANGTVVRPTGVFGREAEPPKNFVLRLIASLRRGETVSVPNDQVANPTYAEELARAVVRIAGAHERGIWHVAGPEQLARSDFARRIAKAFDLREDLIRAAPTAELGQKARRPLQGGLRCERYARRFGSAPCGPLDAALADLRRSLSAVAAR